VSAFAIKSVQLGVIVAYRVELVDLGDLERTGCSAPMRDAHRAERQAAKAGIPRIQKVGIADARATGDNGAHFPVVGDHILQRIDRKKDCKLRKTQQ